MLRACLGPGNGRRCPDGRLTRATRCDACRRAVYRARQAERDPAEVRFYGSSAWQRLRGEILAAAGYRCEVPGCPQPATSAGHIYPIRTHPELALSRANVKASCGRHQRLAQTVPPGSPLPV